MTDRPPADAEGVRIAASRAGQQDGDEWDLDDEAWKNVPPPTSAWDGDDPDDIDPDDIDPASPDRPAGNRSAPEGPDSTDVGPADAVAPDGRHTFAGNTGQKDGGDHTGGKRRRGESRAARRRQKRGAPGAGTPAMTPPATAPPAVRPPATAPARLRPPAATAPQGATMAGLRAGEPSPARRKVLRQRRRRRRTLIACTFLTTVCTFVAGVGYVYVHNRLSQIRRVDLASLAADEAGAVMNVLLVGSDSRAGLDGTETESLGGEAQVPGQRSDTIMILHVDPREQRAAIVSVPRDLYVPIAGANTADRVNAAFALGGPDQLIATIQGALGITINHYVEVDFQGFKDIVDAVGGVTMYVPFPARDTVTGLTLDRGGCLELDGEQGLSWVRSRQMEFLINGTWQADGRGDLGRIERQQDFIRRMMKEALSSGISNPLELNRLIGVGVRHVVFDDALSTKDLTALGRRFSSLDPDKVVLNTLPTNAVNVAGKEVLTLQTAAAQPMIDLLNGTVPVPAAPAEQAAPSTTVGTTATTATRSAATATGGAGATTTTSGALKASDVKVRVLNGLGAPGAAAKAATSLTSLGFTVADKGDATSISAKTTITYGSGQLEKAQLLQSSLITSAVLREDATLRAVDVNLVLGADYTGVKSGISSGTSAASTTVAPPTTVGQISPVPLPEGTTAPPC